MWTTNCGKVDQFESEIFWRVFILVWGRALYGYFSGWFIYKFCLFPHLNRQLIYHHLRKHLCYYTQWSHYHYLKSNCLRFFLLIFKIIFILPEPEPLNSKSGDPLIQLIFCRFARLKYLIRCISLNYIHLTIH